MRKVYFIGIGGIGMSALAKYYLAQGIEVEGSDLYDSEIVSELKQQGANIHLGNHQWKNLSETVDLVIYTTAINKDNPELQQAQSRSYLPVLSYPQALGELTTQYTTIAVSGTHGKSTTTALISSIFEEAGLDPTVIVGTKLNQFSQGNFRKGNSRYLIIEAGEFKEAFTNYWPQAIVLTNLEEDHLDYYQNLNHLQRGFQHYLDHLPQSGTLVFNADDTNVRNLVENHHPQKKRAFSFSQQETKDIKHYLTAPGKHNIYNALAALELSRSFGIPLEVSLEALKNYQGTWRRFDQKEVQINGKQIILIDDYAHHPTEVKATLEAAREKYPHKKIRVVFQPHQYQRLYHLFDQFKNVLQEVIQHNFVDQLSITDIYKVPGREEKRTAVTSNKLVEQTDAPLQYIPYDKIYSYCQREPKPGEVLILMGAGNIYNISRRIREEVSY